MDLTGPERDLIRRALQHYARHANGLAFEVASFDKGASERLGVVAQRARDLDRRLGAVASRARELDRRLMRPAEEAES